MPKIKWHIFTKFVKIIRLEDIFLIWYPCTLSIYYVSCALSLPVWAFPFALVKCSLTKHAKEQWIWIHLTCVFKYNKLMFIPLVFVYSYYYDLNILNARNQALRIR